MRSIVWNPRRSTRYGINTKCWMESFRRNVWNQSEGNTPAVMPYTLRVIPYALRRCHTNPSDWIKTGNGALSHFVDRCGRYPPKWECSRLRSPPPLRGAVAASTNLRSLGATVQSLCNRAKSKSTHKGCFFIWCR